MTHAGCLDQCGPKYRDSGIDTRIALIRDSDSDSDTDSIDTGMDTLGIVDHTGLDLYNLGWWRPQLAYSS
jgi:hypothetical protein